MTVQLKKVGDGSGGVDASTGILTVEQAAECMGVSTRTIRRLILARKIRHLRIGSLIRFYAPDVERFLEDSVVEIQGQHATGGISASQSTGDPSARSCSSAQEIAGT